MLRDGASAGVSGKIIARNVLLRLGHPVKPRVSPRLEVRTVTLNRWSLCGVMA
jgi:hypothetical protein